MLQGESTEEKQQVIQMLCRISEQKAGDVLVRALQRQLTSEAEMSIRLDLLEAAQERGEKGLIDVARKIESQRDEKDPLGTTESASWVAI